jgi:hypothetical protein
MKLASGDLNSDMVPKFLKMYTPWLKHLRVYKQSRQFTNHMEVYGVTFLS